MTQTLPVLDREKTAGVLTDPDTSAFVVFMISLITMGRDFFGPDGFPDPVLVYAELQERYGIWIPEELETKLQAMMLVAENPEAFQDDADAFLHVCSACWDGDIEDIIDGIYDSPDIDEVSWALVETGLLMQETPEFSEPIRRIITGALRDGIESPEEIVWELQERAERIVRDLGDCGFPADVVATVARRLEAMDYRRNTDQPDQPPMS